MKDINEYIKNCMEYEREEFCVAFDVTEEEAMSYSQVSLDFVKENYDEEDIPTIINKINKLELPLKLKLFLAFKFNHMINVMGLVKYLEDGNTDDNKQN